MKNLQKELEKGSKKYEEKVNEEFKELEEKYKKNKDKSIIYKIKFIDSFRFISTSLSNLVGHLSGRITENGKCDNCDSYLDYIKIRNNGRLIFECFDCKRRYTNNISDESLKE